MVSCAVLFHTTSETFLQDKRAILGKNAQVKFTSTKERCYSFERFKYSLKRQFRCARLLLIQDVQRIPTPRIVLA
jgi:hypothetical protein